MAGKGDGEGEGNVLKLENQILVIKYVILFTNIILAMIGLSLLVLCIWLRVEPGIADFLEKLNSTDFYIGLYVLIVCAILVMIVSVIGCLSALQESALALLVYIGAQVLGFIFGLAGAAVLLDNSARDSHFQPKIRESMRKLIINAHHEPSRQALAMIQEGIGCCGADGAKDYLSLKQPLPNECRDSVTGNPFFHGCVDELTWFFEQKCAWVAGLAMTICFFYVINIVLATILRAALEKEEEQSQTYRK
ncbi:tetraspanin-2A [Tribolium castaneum]|uniref:tetraspanin-2A n=1 Tax=Tribolium castaneum TaxID=7070 RepID=UPI0000D55DC8|nr:PREDICTED: CD9 antigen [Tribolium castaneum]|eukprot:XP_974194.1 PREDICTED: CD9 antigen [Tribolium castaneum]